MWRAWERREVYMSLVGKPTGKNHSEDQVIDGRMGSKWILGRSAGREWSGFTWLRLGVGGRLL
jgi:hypothetical protein